MLALFWGLLLLALRCQIGSGLTSQLPSSSLRHDDAARTATSLHDTHQVTPQPDAQEDASYHTCSRRSALAQMTAGAIAVTSQAVLQPQVALAADDATTTTTPISASWTATQGLNSLNDQTQNFVGFNPAAYSAMVKDASRTPLFEAAIQDRLKTLGPDAVVLDLGTGPFALFAVMAAQAGAKKVYAIEANPQAAELAQQRVTNLGYDNVIQILTGFSTDITLPQKADLVVAEIVGSIASEEGAYATLLDAAQRLVQRPNNPNSWIPQRIQTYAAPAAYTLHNLLTPPAFDWTKLGGEPVRFNCRDQGLQLLDDPVLVEDLEMAQLLSAKSTASVQKQVTFAVNPQRCQENTVALEKEIGQAARYLKKPEVQQVARQAASSVTGIAMWPRLILNGNDNTDTNPIVVNSRQYPTGQHQKSHWQTVLPIMSPTPIATVPGQSQITVNFDFTWPRSVTQPPTYKIEGTVIV